MDAKTEAHFIRSACVDQPDDIMFSRKYILEVADLIDQQGKQIEDMKKCSNCKCESIFAGCGHNTCVNKSEWKWDGGSGE